MQEMSAQTIKSRARAPNFSREEQLLFLQVMESYTHIIENKKTDEVKTIVKQETWAKITEIFNANNKNVHRTTENLISCYRNMKSKIKKQHSDAKMVLADSSQRQKFIDAVEENGRDWVAVSECTNQSAELCEKQFGEFEKELKRKETAHKKKIMGTGGGPPPSDNDDPLDQLKKLIEPQLDGLYTAYDGDALLMQEYQVSLPVKDRIMPIENNLVVLVAAEEESEVIAGEKKTEVTCVLDKFDQDTPKRFGGSRLNRTEILKKRKSSALICNDKTEGSPKKIKKNVKESFTDLSEAKLELVQLQKESLQLDIEHKKKMNSVDLEDMEHKKKMKSLELEEKIKEYKHNEEMRQKELLLLDLKIKQLS